MPWVNDEYLVDHKERTLTPLTEELRDEMGRIRSSSRYAIKAVSGEFERLVREGYRVIQKMGGDLFKNPSLTSDHYTAGWKAGFKEREKNGKYNYWSSSALQDEIRRGKGHKYSLSVTDNFGKADSVSREWTDGFLDGFYKRVREFGAVPYKPEGHRTGYSREEVVFMSPSYSKVVQWVEANNDRWMREHPTHPAVQYGGLSPRYEEIVATDVEGPMALKSEWTGRRSNPDYNAFTKSQFDALRQMNKAYPKGDVFLGEIKLKPGERFSDALVAVERLSRATGIDHDVVTYQGKYYSAPTEWVERVVVDTRMEARGKGARSSSEQRSGGGIRGAMKAGWRELMSNPYGGHRISQKPKGKKLPHFITMVKDPIGLWFKVDGLGDRRFTNFNEAVAAYHAARKQWEMREQAERESQPNRVVYNESAGTLTVYTNGAEMESLPVKDRREARRIFSDHYYDTHNLVFA